MAGLSIPRITVGGNAQDVTASCLFDQAQRRCLIEFLLKAARIGQHALCRLFTVVRVRNVARIESSWLRNTASSISSQIAMASNSAYLGERHSLSFSLANVAGASVTSIGIDASYLNSCLHQARKYVGTYRPTIEAHVLPRLALHSMGNHTNPNRPALIYMLLYVGRPYLRC